jgi:hypothetical protein
MSDEPEKAPVAPNTKRRPDDRRGTPPGKGTVEAPNGGRIGNPPFVPTPEQREKVKAIARLFPVHGEHYIARMVGISRDTLRRHFADDMLLGRAEMLAGIASQMIHRAMDADAVGPDGRPVAKGDIEAQKYILARLGGWTTKVEFGEKAAMPFGAPAPDLSNLTQDELEIYGRLAAKAEGLDPDDVVGPADD